MELISFMPNEDRVKDLNENWKKFYKIGIHGIETVIADYIPENVFQELPIKGQHIIYFPSWYKFWKGETEKCYWMDRPEEIVESFKKQFELGKKYKVEYMVFHVSHVNTEEVFTMDITDSDEEVLEACIEIINEVFKGEGPLLLFENLPWAGLNFSNYERTKEFFERINYSNKGFLLDLSHLTCLNKEIKSFDEAAEIIKMKLDNLQELKNNIYGIHINGSLSGEYLKRDFSGLLKEWMSLEGIEKYKLESNHISAIDQHEVFSSYKISEIFDKIPLKYLVYELKYDSVSDLFEKVVEQKKYIEKDGNR